MKNLMQNFTKSKCRALQVRNKNPILEARSQQDTQHLFRIRSEES